MSEFLGSFLTMQELLVLCSTLAELWKRADFGERGREGREARNAIVGVQTQMITFARARHPKVKVGLAAQSRLSLDHRLYPRLTSSTPDTSGTPLIIISSSPEDVELADLPAKTRAEPLERILEKGTTGN